MVLLAQIGTSGTLLARVAEGGSVHRALERSPKLDDRIISALSVDEKGRVIIQPEFERVNRVIQKMILGLYVLRYGKVPLIESIVDVAAYPYNIDDLRPIETVISAFTERFRRKRWKTVQKGVFSYTFVKTARSNSHYCCLIDFHNNVWGVGYVPLPRSRRSREVGAQNQLELPL